MANRTGTKMPAELRKNFYSQKQKNPQADYYSEHLAPYYRKGLEPPEELKTGFYEIALDLLLQSLELDIRIMMYLVYDKIEKHPHKRDKLLMYAQEETEKIEQQMKEAAEARARLEQEAAQQAANRNNLPHFCSP